MKRWLLMLLVVAGISPAVAQEKPAVPPVKAPIALPAGVTQKLDVTYATGKTGPLLADFYLPGKSEAMPAVIFIHGGGWQNGDRTQLRKVAAALSGKGYVGMMIDYDLSSKGGDIHFPTALYECKEAVRWLRAHAAEYHVDPNRIAVAGSSAGGQLSAMMGATSGDPAYDGDGKYRNFPSTVRAAIVFNGELDLTADKDTSVSVLAYLGGTCASLRKLCEDASPQKHIHAGMVPFYVGHGTADSTVDFSQYTNFVAAMKAAGNQITGFPAKDAKHTYWNDPRYFQPNVEAVEVFLDGVVGKK